MQLTQLLRLINRVLPPETAMEGDRIGLQIQSGVEDVQRILVSLELNEEVINEAVSQQTDCIITFHPLIFNPLMEIHDEDRVGKLTTLLIKNSIALISVHTAFDAYSEGTSKILADRLGLKVKDFLAPDSNYTDRGLGVIAEAPEKLTEDQLIKKVSEICKSPVRYTSGKKKEGLKNIAILGGSGSSFIDEALKAEVDAFITADVKYHSFHYVFERLLVIDPGHYEMEQFVPEALGDLFKDNLRNENIKSIEISSILTNPVSYYPYKKEYKEEQKKYLIKK